MKMSEQWLRSWVNPPISRDVLCEQLTAAGLEIEEAFPVVPFFQGVITAEIIAAVPHPNADKLQVCTVHTGQQDLQIVCGAKNARAGIKVALAMVGAELPTGFKIGKAKLRDVESFGMLCSEKELGLAEQSDGIWELPILTPVGLDVRTHFHLDDHIIDINITPNRGDCLSVLGLAREMAVANQLPQPGVKNDSEPCTSNQTPNINIAASAACPRYLARMIESVDMQAKLPSIMIDRLKQSGIRSINPIVDILNYVMLEYGQPMHGFDRDCVQGDITVRFAEHHETLTALDGNTLKLDSDTLVIADKHHVLAVAGIVGGLDSGITEKTNTIILESAFFTPDIIRGKARRYKQLTESAHRFERGVDFELPRAAMEHATHLIVRYCGGKPGEIVEHTDLSLLPARSPIQLRLTRIERVLGFTIPSEVIERILLSLSMRVNPTSSYWNVIAPSYRYDVTTEEDLIEEIARIYGYDRLPTVSPHSDLVMSSQNESTQTQAQLRQVLINDGFYDTLTYSFVDPVIQRLFIPEGSDITLQNPIASDLAVMRKSLWINLAQALVHNQQHNQARVRLFEIGRVFYHVGTELQQPLKVAGLISGERYPEQWATQSENVDFYDLKSNVIALVPEAEFIADQHSSLHPGQSARIEHRGESIGWVGALHPRLIKALGIKGVVYVFELDVAKISQITLPHYQPLVKFPAISRDLAIIAKNEITFSILYATVTKAAGKHLVNLECIDDYRGAGIPAGQRSLLLRLTWQDEARTLVADEVNASVDSIIKMLSSSLNVTLRA